MSSVYSNPVTELIARMNYHASTAAQGRILSGFHWYEMPMEHPDGQTDFPSVQLFLPDLQEEYRAAQQGMGMLQLKMAVSTLRSDRIPALLDAVAKVLNAIETDTSGQINPGFKGSLQSPVELSVENCFSLPLSLNAEVTIRMKPRIFGRGNR